jgi:carbamoyltransferase
MSRTYYLGLAHTVHDSALAIVNPEGEVVFAEATERYMQYKRAFYAVPDDIIRIRKLLDKYAEPDAKLVVAHSWKQRRWLSVGFRAAYQLFESKVSPLLRPTVVGQVNSYDLTALNLEYRIAERGGDPKTLDKRFYDHHTTHAAASCYSSPYREALVAVIDANGEKGSQSFFRYEDGRITTLKQHRRRDFRKFGSLGVFYSGLCLACGFDPIGGEEWKVMGLAPYGKKSDALYAKLRPMLRVDGLDVFGDNVTMLETFLAMRPDTKVPAIEHRDLAFTGQVVFSEVSAELLRNLREQYRSDNLVLSGGCALNSSWNGKIVEQTGFKNAFIFSAPADDGNAIGAALLAYYEDHPPTRAPARVQVPYLGERMSRGTLEHVKTFGKMRNTLAAGASVTERTAELLAAGKIVGWVQGRAEFGPRALGNRSILADPRSHDIKETINARVKFREEFRPFAPSILHDYGPEYFENYQETPYMERTLAFRAEVKDKVPGVVHVDGTGRLQSVKREWNERYYDLIEAFRRRTGIPLVLNTSFNVMGKPIIHTVEDALAVFYTSGLDVLVIEDEIFEKPET